MIREPRFTEGGQYRIDNDQDRAAALLSTLKVMSTGGAGVAELREIAREIVHDVEQARWKVRVNYTVEGCGTHVRMRDIDILTKVACNSRDSAVTWARDSATDALYDWANDQGLLVRIKGTEILSRNDR